MRRSGGSLDHPLDAGSCPRRPGAVGPGLPPSPRHPAASCPPSSTRGEPAMRAALYARVSTERQERFQTIDSQLAALRDWAATGGHEISDDFVFRDEGYSGSRLDRPGLDALRDAVRDGVVGIVAVLTPDRLARKYAYQVLLLEEFRRTGVEIVFLQHPISDDPNDQLLLQIQGAIAEYERAVLGERFRRGKLQTARDGHYQGGCAPYGYRSVPRQEAVPGHLVVDEKEAALVRTLYGWLIDERTTIRQILKRLNAGSDVPRSGRHAWSPSLVHHILADPVYAGTAYANRYSFVPPRKPRRPYGPRTGEATCRQLKPREQWIAIPVPAIVDQETWDRAQAQLARNAALSFRNNTQHNYLLRCLMTCATCGLAMFGRTYAARGKQPERRSYQCHGKDCILSARPAACPSRNVKAEEIEAAVWDHVAGLLASPERLVAQFDHVAVAAEAGTVRDRAADQQLRARLDRVARADKRLLDAYEAGAVTLAELSERRRHLADERLALERQQQERDHLRRQRVQAEAVRTSLEAFCDRLHARLNEATFADKQAISQLVIERIIVGDGRLEIRHVIPLRPSPQPSNNGPVQPTRRLRSDGVNSTALMRGVEDLRGRGPEPLVVIGDDELHAPQAPIRQRAQKRRPERFGFRRAGGDPQHLAPAVGVHAHSDYHSNGDDPAGLARFQVRGVDPQIGPGPLDRPGEEGVDPLIDLSAQTRNLALGDAGRPHGFDQVVHRPGRDPMDVGLLDHGRERLLGGPPWLQKGREVRALAQLRDGEVDPARPCVPDPLAVAVAVIMPLGAANPRGRSRQGLDFQVH